MQLITIDFETYYTDKANGEYSLTWMTAEEYIRDPRFESIGFSIAVNDEEPVWYTGDHAYQQAVLDRFDWDNSIVLGHNMSEFDSLILSHHFGIVPRGYACTLQMARRFHGHKTSNSLGNLAKHYNLYAEKGTEVEEARNKRRKDFSPAGLAAYGAYCVKDAKLCRQLYHMFRKRFPADEQRLMSLFTRMFADARLHLDQGLLQTMLDDMAIRKSGLLDNVADMLQIGVGLPRDKRLEMVQKELRSDAKFARILDEEFGIDPPRKLSPKQKNEDGSAKVVFAFAKTDEAMTDLLEDEDPDVQALAAARLGVKSTIAESRMERFLGISKRGALPVPLVYGKTHTDRAAGGGKINLQNMSRPAKPGPKTPMGTLVNVGGDFDRLLKYNKLKELFMLAGDNTIIKPKEAHIAGLRDAIIAPPGYKLVVADSSNIELRVCHLLAGQLDTIAKLRSGIDLYCDMGQDLYGYQVLKGVHEKERQHGKVAHLQLQFQSGAGAFRRAARIMGGIRLTDEEAESTVEVYRRKHAEIKDFWVRCRQAVIEMANGTQGYLDQWGLVKIDKNRLVMPNGMHMEYFDLRQDRFNPEDLTEPLVWMYDDKETRKRKKCYGGSVTENITQALARIVVFEQMLEIEKKYGRRPGQGVVLTVHDEIVALVQEDLAEQCLKDMLDAMGQAPRWWPDLPVKAEGDIGDRYSECK